MDLYIKKYSASDNEILEIIEISKKNQVNEIEIKRDNEIYNFYKTYDVYTNLNSNFISNSTTINFNSINYTYNINFNLYLPSDFSPNGAFINTLVQNVKQIELQPFDFKIGRVGNTFPRLGTGPEFCYVLIQNLSLQCIQDKETKYHYKFDNYFSHNLINEPSIYTFEEPIQILSNIILNFFYHNNLIYIETDFIPIYPFNISLKFKCLY